MYRSKFIVVKEAGYHPLESLVFAALLAVASSHITFSGSEVCMIGIDVASILLQRTYIGVKDGFSYLQSQPLNFGSLAF